MAPVSFPDGAAPVRAGTQTFWRDPALAFVEARQVVQARSLCYAPHTHEQFSFGAIDGGRAVYRNGGQRHALHPGMLTLINPGDVHACNPEERQDWSFRMLYVDVPWLQRLQAELGLGRPESPHLLKATLSRDPVLYRGFDAMYRALVADAAEPLLRESALVGFLGQVHARVERIRRPATLVTAPMRQVADYIHAHHARPLRLDELCAVAGLPAWQLIRAFRKVHGLTPHAYLLDCRFRRARAALRQGVPIAEAAYRHGYADQAHLQRCFKRAWAVTPGRYRAGGTQGESAR